jgi:uncharacterized membrane protein required for colicin V production
MVDLICLVVIGLGLLWGWRKGLVLGVLSVAGALCAYAGALFLYRPLSTPFSAIFALQPLLAYPLGGILAFSVIGIIFALAGHFIRRRRRRLREEGSTRSVIDQAGGAVLGAAQACLMVVTAVWFLIALQGIRPGKTPWVDRSVAAKVVKPLFARALQLIASRSGAGPTGQRVIASIAEQPESVALQLKTVVTNTRLRSLLGNRALVRALSAATARPGGILEKTVTELVADRELVAAAQGLGLIGRTAEQATPDQVRDLLLREVSPVLRRGAAIAQDGRIQAILEDPEITARLKRRDVIGLANNARFNQLVSYAWEHLQGE